jgi:tRNA pseudouridine38-40 synthase
MAIFYKLLISYDGTNYHGWQEQSNAVTVSGAIKKAIKKIFQLDCSIVGASRTDTGVHARCQWARIRLEKEIDPDRLKEALNNLLPNDILIHSVAIITDGFHPFYNVYQKTYHYQFFTKRPSPFTQRFGWYYHKPIDMDKLQQALAVFEGTHDFVAFATDTADKDTIRTIESISLQWGDEAGAYSIIIKGKSFMHHMVRRIVGAALAVASKEAITIDDLKEELTRKKIRNVLPTAPAKGLTLDKIIYNEPSK